MTQLVLIGLLVLGSLSSTAPAQDVPPAASAAPDPAAWTDAQKEAFLLEAKVVRRRSAPGGVTGSKRVTLEKDGVQHDAHVQIIDEHKTQFALGSGLEMDFRDSWRNNVAAYRLDRLMGLRMIPVTVSRNDEYKLGSFTWWIDDVLMTEKERYTKKIKALDAEAWNRQVFVVRVFDQLIYNTDRNLGNLVIDKDWRLWMIDHSRGFKIFKELKLEKNLGALCEADLLAGLRKLDKATLMPLMKGLLAEGQVDGLLGRRDKIVRHFEQQIAARGEAAVLYDLPPRP
jgi:hypothetical protein